MLLTVPRCPGQAASDGAVQVCLGCALYSPQSTNKYAQGQGPSARPSPSGDGPRQRKQAEDAVGRDAGTAFPHQPFSSWKNVALS